MLGLRAGGNLINSDRDGGWMGRAYKGEIESIKSLRRAGGFQAWFYKGRKKRDKVKNDKG